MIDQATLEAHKLEPLDEHEVRFQRLLNPTYHRPAGAPRKLPVLQARGYARTTPDKLLAAVPQDELTRLFGTKKNGEPKVTDKDLSYLLMQTKVLGNGDVAFPLVAREDTGDVKRRVRVVRASDIARWMPALGAVAGITDNDIMDHETYEVLL